MRTVAVVNQKGGCGKTTVSINLASALADLGKKVLLVDMDPQSHCAVGLAVPEEQIEQSMMQSSELGMVGIAIGFVTSIIIDPLFGLLGGLIGYSVYKPKPGMQPPVAPPTQTP